MNVVFLQYTVCKDSYTILSESNEVNIMKMRGDKL